MKLRRVFRMVLNYAISTISSKDFATFTASCPPPSVPNAQYVIAGLTPSHTTADKFLSPLCGTIIVYHNWQNLPRRLSLTLSRILIPYRVWQFSILIWGQ